MPEFLRTGIVEPMVRLLPVKTKNLSFDYKAMEFVRAPSMIRSLVITSGLVPLLLTSSNTY